MRATIALCLLATLLLAPAMPGAQAQPASGPPLQGWAPGELGLAIAPDGKTAYVPFALDDALLVVDLPTMTAIASIDVSTGGRMLGSCAATLTPDGRTLFVANPNAGNVLVVDTAQRQVEKVLPLQPLYAVAIALSTGGQQAYVSSNDGSLYVVNTDDASYERIFVPGVIFGAVAPAPGQPNLLYSAGSFVVAPGTFQSTFFAFNLATHAVVRSASLPAAALPTQIMPRRLVINAAENRAYFGYTTSLADRRAGNLTVFDLATFAVASTAPVENGVADFAVDAETGYAYIVGFWSGGSGPGTLPVHEWGLASNSLHRDIMVSPSADQRAIRLDPAGGHFYMTEGDHNLLRKVDIVTGQETGRVRFNREQWKPYAFLRDGNTGYVVCEASRRVFKLDLTAGEITGSFLLPFDVSAWGVHAGRLFVGGGDQIAAIDTANGALVARYSLGRQINAKLFTFYGERMATIDYAGGMIGRTLILFDANTMAILKTVDLPAEPHGDRVIVSPDGDKLYVERGTMMGTTTTITIYDAATLAVVNTLAIPAADLRNGASSFVEGDFDETHRVLYLAGFTSIYRIDMDTDLLLGKMDLIDLYETNGFWGWSPTGLSGLLLSAAGDRVYTVSGDAHSMFTYDLTQGAWSTEITNVRGYFCTDALGSPDRTHLYTCNSRSDSITMVDLATGEVERILDLHECVREVYLPRVLRAGM